MWVERALLAAAEGSTHGVHPAAQTDAGVGYYFILGIVIVGVAWIMFMAIRMTLKPGENEEDHIKRTVLKDD